MVHPAHQRRGTGSELIQWGLTNLLLEGMPIWLTAQQSTLAFNIKSGWEIQDVVEVELGEWDAGYSGLLKTFCMLRQPRAWQPPSEPVQRNVK